MTQYKSVFGSNMAYLEQGEGTPIIFLHGNPTSNYLWRDVMPHAADLGRCIAPDLIGMGASAKLASAGPHRYTLREHYRYLRELLYQLNVNKEVVLVLHDWGSALGFHWANEHPEKIRGICFMEAIVMPVSWKDWPPEARRIFQGFRSEEGEDLILNRNLFVERVLPGSLLETPTEEHMAVYRQPIAQRGEDRRPTLTWPREIPIDEEPRNVVELVNDYGQWLVTSEIPKLFINADPGAILTGPQREFCRSWPNLSEVTVRAGHFVPEDAPHEVGETLAEWIQMKLN